MRNWCNWEHPCLPSKSYTYIMELSTQYKGIITELQVATYLLSLGYMVSQPLGQDSKYDLIVDVEGKLLRLQVKTSRPASENSITFNCRTTTSNVKNCKSRRYSEEEVDYFATYWDGIVYLVPISECSTQKSLHKNASFKRKDWSYMEDYEASEVLKRV